MRCRSVLGSFVRVGSAEEDVARLVREQIGFSVEFVSMRRAVTWTVRPSTTDLRASVGIVGPVANTIREA